MDYAYTIHPGLYNLFLLAQVGKETHKSKLVSFFSYRSENSGISRDRAVVSNCGEKIDISHEVCGVSEAKYLIYFELLNVQHGKQTGD